MIDELKKLREITETLTGNGYLKDQAEEWEYALDAIPDCVYIINNRFEIKFCNKALCNKLGSKKEDLYGRLCYEVIFGCNNRDLFPGWSVEDLNQDAIIITDVFVDKLSGWYDVTRSPIYTKNSRLIGFICVLQDVTGKHIANDNLHHRETLLETIFNVVPVGVMLMDRKNRTILSVNRYMVDITGYSEYELLCKTDRVLYSSDDMYEEVSSLINNSLQVGSTTGKIMTKDKKELLVTLSVSAVGKSMTDKVVLVISEVEKCPTKLSARSSQCSSASP